MLSRNPDLRSADSLIALAAHDNPRRLYDYAAGNTRLAGKIRNHNDNLVKTVARMANNRSGQLYFPFLDNILKGNITFEEVDKVKENDFDYYKKPFPKSLANSFGTDELFPLVQSFQLSANDALRTYVEHICEQVVSSIVNLPAGRQVVNGEWSMVDRESSMGTADKMLVTGGGAFNNFLIQRLSEKLRSVNIEVVVPEEKLVKYKEALVMALIGVLRWRQEYNVLSSVTGASRDSIGGAVWQGQEA